MPKSNLSALAVRRLTKLADYMHRLQLNRKRKFDMARWLSEDECGTVACAAGWATKVPSLRKEGFRLHQFYSSEIAKFFGVYWGLFDSSLAGKIKTPKQWARHCRRFIKENRA